MRRIFRITVSLIDLDIDMETDMTNFDHIADQYAAAKAELDAAQAKIDALKAQIKEMGADHIVGDLFELKIAEVTRETIDQKKVKMYLSPSQIVECTNTTVFPRITVKLAANSSKAA